MQQKDRWLSVDNVDHIASDFIATLDVLGDSIHGLRGVALLTALKRVRLEHGPYVGVTMFEAANRIMSDLVILRGVAVLLKERVYPFKNYLVEFGNEDVNGFDIRAENGEATLVGEAFNVAPSFFQIKKGQAVNKLVTKGGDATYRLVIANEDSVRDSYLPRATRDVKFLFVNVETGRSRFPLCSSPMLPAT
jgi:hypothetical protein